jgi:hypothetical protein
MIQIFERPAGNRLFKWLGWSGLIFVIRNNN